MEKWWDSVIGELYIGAKMIFCSSDVDEKGTAGFSLHFLTKFWFRVEELLGGCVNIRERGYYKVIAISCRNRK